MTPLHRQPRHVQRVGGTNATAVGWRARRWARYYHATYRRAVTSLLRDATRGAVLDLGTSHGHWRPILGALGFERVHGVELDAGRAALAAAAGYDGVANADGVELPFRDDSFDAVLSNDVFVHILEVEAKAAEFREVARVLRPGGVFVVNHPMAAAFGMADRQIEEHCSFLSVDTFLRLAMADDAFRVVDIRPSFYRHRSPHGRSIRYLARSLAVLLPGGAWLLELDDLRTIRTAALEEADTVYLKLVT